MIPLNNIVEVFDLLPIPYLILKQNADSYSVLSTNHAYKKLLKDAAPVSDLLNDHLPFDEPFFRKKFYKHLASSIDSKQNQAFEHQTIHSNYEIKITPLAHPGTGTLLIVSFHIHEVTQA
ncbi:MAG: hypothetical protein V4658_11850, partial [Bacteroidota bacterium]